MLRRSHPLFSKRLIILLAWGLLILGTLVWLTSLQESQEKKALRIFSWSDTLSSDILKKFEEESGIKVHIDYYASNEELIVKLKNMTSQSYDLIIPSDYAIAMLIEQDLLQPLDKSQLTFLKDINPVLLGHDYDPSNTYSLPLEWDVYGFGIDQDIFKDSDKINFSWDHLFNDDIINYKVAMTNDPVDAIGLAACYLFGKKNLFRKKRFLPLKDSLSTKRNM